MPKLVVRFFWHFSPDSLQTIFLEMPSFCGANCAWRCLYIECMCLPVQLNVVQTLLGLLSHDNSDIALAVVDLLQELTDVDTVNESEEKAERLIEALLGEQVNILVCTYCKPECSPCVVIVFCCVLCTYTCTCIHLMNNVHMYTRVRGHVHCVCFLHVCFVCKYHILKQWLCDWWVSCSESLCRSWQFWCRHWRD